MPPVVAVHSGAPDGRVEGIELVVIGADVDNPVGDDRRGFHLGAGLSTEALDQGGHVGHRDGPFCEIGAGVRGTEPEHRPVTTRCSQSENRQQNQHSRPSTSHSSPSRRPELPPRPRLSVAGWTGCFDRDYRQGLSGSMVRSAVAHYAEVFAIEPGRCFHYVEKSTTQQPMPCPGEVRWRGRFRAQDGKSYRVEACDEHVDEGLRGGCRIAGEREQPAVVARPSSRLSR